MKLLKKIIISGEIIAETGLMVGGNSSSYEIGGTDKQIVRNPINKMPYIPGSSLKGKMRSLFELNRKQVEINDRGSAGPCMNPDKEAAQLFGFIKKNYGNRQQPSRLIVRDAELTNSNQFSDTELLYSEIKAENSVDRVSAKANPRFFERVPKGAKFDLQLVINVFDKDVNGSNFLNFVYESLKLVQDDYIGGGGSRGNGKVNIVLQEVYEKSSDYYQGNSSGSKDLKDTIPTELK